jgi:hypothetical protein
MLTKQVVWGSLVTLILFVAPSNRADLIQGSQNAGFQSWNVNDINDNGNPFWDNKSLDVADQTTNQKKKKKQVKNTNVGFNLTGTSAIQLSGAPGDLPYWGLAGKSKKKNGGNADLNFIFQREELTSAATLKLELAPTADIDEFGWYDVTNPTVLHPIFLGPDSPVTNETFSPSAQYGFYMKRGNEATFYTESALNPYKDRKHQHFAVFQESSTPGSEIYWIGIESNTRRELKGKEGSLGDYNDMLIRITESIPLPVPEPSTAVLVLSSSLLVAWLRKRRC